MVAEIRKDAAEEVAGQDIGRPVDAGGDACDADKKRGDRKDKTDLFVVEVKRRRKCRKKSCVT